MCFISILLLTHYDENEILWAASTHTIVITIEIWYSYNNYAVCHSICVKDLLEIPDMELV